MNKHDSAKNKICRWCCCKVGKIRINSNNLTDTKLGQLYTTYFEEIDGFDENRPHVLCNTCKFYFFKKSSGVLPLELPSRFDWPTIQNTRLGTCSEQNPCQMCTEIGPRNQAPALIIHSKPEGPP